MNETQTPNKPVGLNPMIALGVIVVLAIVAFAMFNRQETDADGDFDGDVAASPTTALTLTSTPSVTTSTTPAVEGAQDLGEPDQAIEVEGGSFFFKPNEIRVKKGETVKITLKNSGGLHDFVIDELNVRTPQINSGQTADVTFVADKTGSFEFYCSVGKHREMGMKGTLIVE